MAGARDQSALAQVLSLALLGGYAGFYLPTVNQIGATSTDATNLVKQHLAQSPISSDQGGPKGHS